MHILFMIIVVCTYQPKIVFKRHSPTLQHNHFVCKYTNK